jgi:outer membrane lipoprotein LolB
MGRTVQDGALPASRTLSDRCRKALTLFFAIAIFSIAGCAYDTRATGINDSKNEVWSGRLSLQAESEPPQAFFAAFELKGNAQRGELRLTSPLGNVVGVMRWSPQEALLEIGSGVQRFESVDALLEKSTGAALPLGALFDWLSGISTVQRGWSADLSRYGEGRINAVRTDPAPRTTLRLVLNQGP